MNLLPHASPSRRGSSRLIGVLLAALSAAGAAAILVMDEPRVSERADTSSADVAATPVPRPPSPADDKLRKRRLNDWLGEIAEEAELGLVVGPGVDQEVAGAFPPSATWQVRLDAMAATVGFVYVVRDGVLVVQTARAVAPAEPDGPGFSPPREPTRVLSLRPQHARAADIAKALQGVLADRGVEAGADVSSNAILLSGPEVEVQTAAAIVRELDVPRRRFLVEADLVEIMKSARSDLGIQWRIAGSDLAAAANFPIDAPDLREGELTIATGGTVSLKARISALEAEGRARVVARPRILVVEGRPASIESVRILRIRLPDTTSVVAGSDERVTNGSSRAVEEFPVGIKLKVEPSLLGGGKVALRVTTKSSTLGEPLPPDDIPEEFSRLVEADFFVAHGETAVLGGIARAARGWSSSGVPVLRHIPLLGTFFRRRSREHDAEELVVLVTPYLLE